MDLPISVKGQEEWEGDKSKSVTYSEKVTRLPVTEEFT